LLLLQGFCQSEGADCTGVKLETLADRVVKCPRMQAKLERMRAKYAAGKAGAVMHGDDDDDEEEEEEEDHHARHGMENGMGKKKCNKHKGQQAVMGEHGAAVMGIEQNVCAANTERNDGALCIVLQRNDSFCRRISEQ
jgi:hypothetical protein